MATSTAQDWLNGINAGSFPSAKEITIVKSTHLPVEGFKLLVDNNILSAPVYDVKENKFTGFLDIKDLVSFVVFVDDDQNSDAPQNLQDLIMHGCKLYQVPVDGVTCTYLSRRNAFHAVKASESLLKVCQILAKGVHRVPVVDDAGNVVNIISQSMIVQFLAKNLEHLGPDFKKTIAELNLGTHPVVCVKHDTSAIETFRLMDNRKISGVAVIDDTGRFVGNTSASDLKMFMKTLSLETLKLPIVQFLKMIRQESVDDIASPAMGLASTETVEVAVGKLAVTKIHKLFVADDNDGYKPRAVVSITDVLRLLLK